MFRYVLGAVAIGVISQFGSDCLSAQQRPGFHLITQAGNGEISAISFTRDGRDIIAARYDGRIVLWSLASGLELRRFLGHSKGVTSIAVSRDGKQAVSSSEDTTARLWDINTGKQLQIFQGPLNTIISPQVEPDGLKVHSAYPQAVDISPDGKQIVTGSSDGIIRLWDAKSGHEVAEVVAHPAKGTFGVFAVAFSPDGKTILSGGQDPTARLWTATTLKKLAEFRGHTDSISSVAYHPDGLSVLTGSWDHSAKLWSIESTNVLKTFREPSAIAITSVAISSDGHLILTNAQFAATLWNADTGNAIGNLQVDSGVVRAAALSPIDSTAVTAGQNMTVGVWNIDTKSTGALTKVKTIVGASSDATCIAISADGGELVTGSSDHFARLWDTRTGIQVKIFENSDVVSAVAMSHDGKTLLTGSHDGSVRFWNLESGKEITRLTLSGSVVAAGFLDDGDRVFIAAGVDAGLWEFRTGRRLGGFAHNAEIFAAVLSPDGTTVFTSSLDQTTRLWSLQTFNEIRRFDWPQPVTSMALSPDGKTMLTGGIARFCQLWDLNSGRELFRFDGLGGRFSADGQVVLTGIENTVRLWDVSSGRQIQQFQLPESFNWPGPVMAIAKSKNEYRVFASVGGSIQIWDSLSATSLLTLVSYTGGGWAVVDQNGRFDAGNLEGQTPLHWIVNDDPSRPLPIEVLMRDYFEPGLLPRVLEGERFSTPDVAFLNRVQPLVDVTKLEWIDATTGRVRVTVKVRGNKDKFPRNGKEAEMETGVYDLRLFRDGQLVGWEPKSSVKWQLEPPTTGADAEKLDLLRWRQYTQVKLDRNGAKEFTFQVQVPRRTDLKQIMFTAYAFNEDRVKSATASGVLSLTSAIKPRAGRAYVISTGVNRTESSPNWDLRYAANDARKFSAILQEKLKATKQYEKVVVIRLVSDTLGSQQANESAATRKNLHAVLDVLAGRRRVDEQLKKEIPGAAALQKAQPEDLLLLSFSSHGFTDSRGVFHVVLEDIGKDQPQDRITEGLRKNSLSSDQLSAWLRDVDAGELAMIVDACHSEASIAYDGFKPGPMGSRGLGQLAYDKGMRILAASKSKQSAIEVGEGRGGEKIDEGLLSYALLHEGLELGQADFQPKDGAIMLSEWLAYGAQEVPRLITSGNAQGAGGAKPMVPKTRDVIYLGSDQPPPAYQQPVLFDFAKQSHDVLLSGASLP